MLTAQLLDLRPLISGWYRPDLQLEYHADQVEADPTAENAVAAIDRVLEKHPRAIWTVDGDHGRIVAGDRLVSLPFSVVDSDAELCAWIDASQRLGNGDMV